MTKKEETFELGWQVGHKQTKEDYRDLIFKILGDIETDLHNIWANIPFTYGIAPRKLIKELLDKIDKYKGGKND